MKLPRELVVGDSIWKVRRNRKRQTLRGKVLDGLCDPSEQVIYVYAGLKGKDALSVFCHESIHALEDSLDIEIDHKLIEKLDDAIAQFLIDNFLGPI